MAQIQTTISTQISSPIKAQLVLKSLRSCLSPGKQTTELFLLLLLLRSSFHLGIANCSRNENCPVCFTILQ
ncbi:hypothetical protein ACFX2B_028982 [Malus domestica]